MTTCLGNSCCFCLMCVSFVNVDQFVCVLLSLLLIGWDVDLIVLVLDYCLLFYFAIFFP